MGFYSGSSEGTSSRIRRIARGAAFQLRFRAVGGDACRLFGLEDAYDLSDLQIALFQWGIWYRSIYELSGVDRPIQDVIDVDDDVDAWYTQYTREIQVQAARIQRERQKTNSAAGSAARKGSPHFGKGNG